MVNPKENSNYICVFDIGGTTFRTSVFNQGNLVEEPTRSPTPTFSIHPEESIVELQENLVDQIVQSVLKYSQKYEGLNKIAISIAGPVLNNSQVVQSPSIWGQQGQGFELKSILEAKLSGKLVFVANDLTAAAERYATLSENKSLDYFALITISTGVGVKIYDVQNQKVLNEPQSVAEEIGHQPFDTSLEAPLCDCGGRGHINALASGRALERLARQTAKDNILAYKDSILATKAISPEQITIYLLGDALKQADSFANTLLDRATLPIAKVICELFQKKQVQKFIIVGGFALNLKEIYLNSLFTNIKQLGNLDSELGQLSKLIVFGSTDDCDSLLGVGLLADKSLGQGA